MDRAVETETPYRSDKLSAVRESRPVQGELQQQNKLLGELLSEIFSLDESLASVLTSSGGETTVSADHPEPSYKLTSQLVSNNYIISVAIERIQDIRRRLEI